MNTQYQNSQGPAPMSPNPQPLTQQSRDAYWGAPIPGTPAVASMGAPEPVVATGYEQARKTKSDSFNRATIAFLVLGLFLLGASIVPLAAYLEMSAAQGLLAFDAMLLVSAVVCLVYGFSHSSRMMRYAGLAVALSTVVKISVIDTWSFDSLTKALAYIAGGVACMAIAVLYSRAVKRFEDSSLRSE